MTAGKVIQGIFRLYWTAIAPARKPHRMGLLFTHQNGDFCGNGAKLFHADVENGASPISYMFCARTVVHLDGIKYSGLRTGIYFTEPSRPTASARFSICERLVPVLCRRCSYYTVFTLYMFTLQRCSYYSVFTTYRVHAIPCSHHTNCVHTMPCSHYTVFTLYHVHNILRSYYAVFTLYRAHAIPCSHHTAFTLYRSHTIPCSYHTAFTLYHGHTIPCSHHTVFTLYHVHTIACSYYSVFTLYRVHTIPCSHHTVFKLYRVHTTPCSHHTVFTLYRVGTKSYPEKCEHSVSLCNWRFCWGGVTEGSAT